MCIGDLRNSLEVTCIMVDPSDVYWGSEELSGGNMHRSKSDMYRRAQGMSVT